jgi:hypothetical protein
MMEFINTWLHSNIKSNDEKLLNYTNEACINNPHIDVGAMGDEGAASHPDCFTCEERALSTHWSGWVDASAKHIIYRTAEYFIK